MAGREHPRSLADLPADLLAIIAGLIAATSDKPMEDLHSLRATCKTMRIPCRDAHVGKSLVLERVPIFKMEQDDPAGYDDFIRGLAGLGRPIACFLAGMDDIFGLNRSARPPLDKLRDAAAGGHRGAAYVAALLLYRANGGTDDDETAMAYIRQVEDETGWRPRLIGNMQCMRWRAFGLMIVQRRRTVALSLGRRRPTLPPAVARGNIQHCIGPRFCGTEPVRRGVCMYFCCDECRIRHECLQFFNPVLPGY